MPSRRDLWTYAGPFALFLGLLFVPLPKIWLYPLQTILCGAFLIVGRPARLPGAVPGNRAGRPTVRMLGWGLGVGGLVFLLWIAPQAVFHAAPRLTGGFDPYEVPPGAFYVASLSLRFVRLVLVVPVLEELFWRGFLLRYLVAEDFTRVPFGACTPLSFGGVALGFMLEHNLPDWPAALLAGALYNLVAIRTKSLSACILAHAVTNLLLGLYVMRTQQWGIW